MKNIQFSKILLVISFVLQLCPLQVLSQRDDSRPTTISGWVSDSITSEPLEFATIALTSEDLQEVVRGTVTDKKGIFTFEDLQPGKYLLLVSFIGYLNNTIPVEITGRGEDIRIGNIKLIPDAGFLEEVTIQIQRPDIIQMPDRLVVNIQGSVMAAGNTAYDVLAKAPGVHIDQEGNIQLNGRSGVTVMINDKLTYLSARDLRTLLEGMSAENIRNLEIITNPSARYDAEGSSGILNINLVRNFQQGMNGSVYSSYSFNGRQHGYSAGGNLNYKTDKWNSFLNLDLAKRAGGREVNSTRVFFGEETTYFDQIATGNTLMAGPPALRFGTDYSLNDNNTVGVMASYKVNELKTDFLTETYLGNQPGVYHTFIDAENFSEYSFSNFTTNIHYLSKLDTLGSSISADFDYVKISNSWESNFYNYYDNLNSDDPVIQDFLYTTTPNGLDIYSGKIDLSKIFENSRRFEAGLKASRVNSENDSRFYFNNSSLIPDPNRSNHFLYEENILAAYLNWNQNLGGKFSLQAGLRAENTTSIGESLTTGEVNEREYLNLFPSVFLQQKVSENYGINYSYSRRIQRPNYGSLNPFITYRDPYTYWQGNPELRPQFTHAFGISQTYKRKYNLALNYQLVEDVITELPILVEETSTTIYTLGNVDDSQNLSLTAMAPLKIMKNWDTNYTATLSYNEYKMFVDQRQLVNDRISYMFQSNHNILLPGKFRIEINAAYRGPAASGLYVIEPVWWVHAGIKRSFLKDKLEVNMNFNDIFRSSTYVFKANIGDNINEYEQYFRNRSLGLTLRYNFSKGQKFEPKQRNSGLEEVNRT